MVQIRGCSFLTVAELARRLEVSERTIYVWRSAGRLEGVVRLGKRWLYPEDRLQNLLAKPA